MVLSGCGRPARETQRETACPQRRVALTLAAEARVSGAGGTGQRPEMPRSRDRTAYEQLDSSSGATPSRDQVRDAGTECTFLESGDLGIQFGQRDGWLVVESAVAKGQAQRFHFRDLKKHMRVTSVGVGPRSTERSQRDKIDETMTATAEKKVRQTTRPLTIGFNEDGARTRTGLLTISPAPIRRVDPRGSATFADQTSASAVDMDESVEINSSSKHHISVYSYPEPEPEPEPYPEPYPDSELQIEVRSGFNLRQHPQPQPEQQPEPETVKKDKLKTWWEQRCETFINARFDVLISLWCHIHQVSFEEAKSDKKSCEKADGYLSGDRPEDPRPKDPEARVLQQVLAREVSKEAAQRAMAEIDIDRDGSVSKDEAAKWWQQYSDDLRSFDDAWGRADEDLSGDLDLKEIPAFIRSLLTPLAGQVEHAVAVAKRMAQDALAQFDLQQLIELSKLHNVDTMTQRKVQEEPESGNVVKILVDAIAVHEWWRKRKLGSSVKRDKNMLHSLLVGAIMTQSYFAEAADGPSSADKVNNVQGEDDSNDAPQQKEQNSRFDKLLIQWEQIHRKELNGDIRERMDVVLKARPGEISAQEVERIIQQLLYPTDKGLELVEDEMDVDKSGSVDRSEAENWWLRNCSRDLKAFEKAWLDADVDLQNVLQRDDIRRFLRGDSGETKLRRMNTTALNEALGLGGLTSRSVQSCDNPASQQPEHEHKSEPELEPEPWNEPNPEEFTTNFANPDGRPGSYSLRILIEQGRDLVAMDRNGSSDPYVECKLVYGDITGDSAGGLLPPVTSPGRRTLQKRAEELRGREWKAKTKVKKKNHTNPYWDETLLLELPTRPESESSDGNFDTREFEACRLEIRCYDWDAISKDDLIGEVSPICVDDILHKRSPREPSSQSVSSDPGIDHDYSTPQWLKLKAPGQTDDYNHGTRWNGEVYVAIDVVFTPRGAAAPVKPLALPARGDPQAKLTDPHRLHVRLLGLRDLPTELRHPSVEVVLDAHRHSGQELRTAGRSGRFDNRDVNEIKEYDEKRSQYSRRMYCITDSNEQLNPSVDIKACERQLMDLKPSKLRERASVLGIDPDGAAQSAGRSQLVKQITQAYEDLEFNAFKETQFLTFRVWEKPSLDIGRLRHRHQPQRLVAETHIELKPKAPSLIRTSTQDLRDATQLYKDTIKFLTSREHQTDKQPCGALQPSPADMSAIVAEIMCTATANADGCEDTETKRSELLLKLEKQIEKLKGDRTHDQRARKDRLVGKLAEGVRRLKAAEAFAPLEEAWQRKREVLDDDWEACGNRVCAFPKWQLHEPGTGKPHGYLRAAFLKYEVGTVDENTERLNAGRWQQKKALAKSRSVVVRVYIIEGMQLRAMDRNGSSDPYVLATLSGEKQQAAGDRSKKQMTTLNPDFRQVFEFEITMPGPALLKLQVKDWDRITRDDEIGSTTIDLEHRYFCDQWRSYELKPIEERQLQSRKDRGDNGKLRLWIDMYDGTLASVPPAVTIEKPPPEQFQLRVIVWRAEGMQDDSGKRASRTKDAMNDLYFTGHLRTKLNKKVRDQEQKTDVHWRAKDGKGEFNYRLVYDFEVDPQLPVKRPCTFTLKAWDKDPTLFKSDFLGSKEVHLDKIMDEAMVDAMESKKRRRRIEELTNGGRVGEMEYALQRYKEKNLKKQKKRHTQKLKEREKRRLHNQERSGLIDGLEKKERRCLNFFDCNVVDLEQGLLDGPADNVNDSSDASELYATENYKWENERRWVLRDRGEQTGVVWVTVELLHSSAAQQRKAGKGRGEPNENPVLEEPEREKLSIFHPLSALKFFVGPARMNRAKTIATMALALGVFWAMVPTILAGTMSKFIENIPIFSGPIPCPPSYAKGGAIHSERCGRDLPFAPQRAHWFQCLGPDTDVCRCTADPELLGPRLPGASEQQSCVFDESTCASGSAKCLQGLRAWREQQQQQHGIPADTLWQTLTSQCNEGGELYLLTHYSADCGAFWPVFGNCASEPCEDECVSMQNADCPPPLGGLADAVFKWLILRILVPAIIFGIFCSLRHLDFHMFDGMGCRMLCKNCGCVACGRCTKAKLRNSLKELSAETIESRSHLFGIGVATLSLPVARTIFKNAGIIMIRWKWWLASVPVGLLLGGVARALVYFAVIHEKLVPTLLRWFMYADVFGAMYWMTGTDPWTKL